MHNSPSEQANNRLILTVYLLFILFIALLLVLNSYSVESGLSSKDIDGLIQKKWNENSLKPSEKTSDEEFIRRLYLDLTGRVPTTEEVKTFLNDESSKKRENKINELLNSEEFGQNMADVWISLLFTHDNRKRVPPYIYTMIKNKFADHFNKNKTYTEFVYNLISAEGLATTDPAVLYGARFETPEDAAGTTMKIFMGKQIQCAQCHHHPYENISQEDFYGVAAFFARKNTLPLYKKEMADKITKAISRYEKMIDRARQKELEMNTEANNEMSDEMKNMQEHQNVKQKDSTKVKKDKKRKMGIPPQWAIDTLKKKMSQKEFTPDLLVWDAINGQMQYEVKGEKKTIGPKYLGGPAASSDAGVERRKLLASYLITTESKQLAREFVNRFWKYFFGYGFVNPADDFTDKNPASNPELLDMLADEFVRTNFDIKNLFRLLLNTEAYQLSSTPNSTNKDDHQYFSRGVLRPMSPIQLANSLFTVSGYFNMNNIKNKNSEEIEKIRFRILQLFIYTFEDDEMNEVEDFSGTISQALLLMNSDLAEKVTEKKPGNRMWDILKNVKEPSDRIDAIYLGTLSRYPTKKEKNELVIKANEDESFYEDLQWALLNSSEFIFNH